MHVLDVNEIFWMTFYTYDKIMEEGWRIWPDAVALYIKLMKQARIQQTNQTYSLNEFLKEWLNWGDERLKHAKDVLKALGLMDNITITDKKTWRILWHYVRVNYLIDEEKVRSNSINYNLSTTGFHQGVVESTSWWTDANALSNININAWSNININTTKEKKSIPSVSELVEAYKNNPLLVEKIGDVDVVRERAEYKQAKKNRAYKTVSWFIQQLVVCVETVRFWMPRGDTAQRLRFALNQTCEREWKSVYWNETIEQEYQSWKRNLALTLNKWIQI